MPVTISPVLPSGYNVRDLSQVPFPGGKRLPVGAVVRGEAPAYFDEQATRDLLGYGIGTVIDLRSANETHSEGFGYLAGAIQSGELRYRHVDLTADTRDLVQSHLNSEDMSSTYLACLAAGGSLLAQELAAALDDFVEHGRGVYVHCAVGKDRTGTAVAALLHSLGADVDDIVTDFMATGDNIWPLVDRLRKTETYRQMLTGVRKEDLLPARASIEGVLNSLPPSRQWFESNGVHADRVLRWRTDLLW